MNEIVALFYYVAYNERADFNVTNAQLEILNDFRYIESDVFHLFDAMMK